MRGEGGREMGISTELMLLIQLHETCDVIWPKKIRALMYEVKCAWKVLVRRNHIESDGVAPAACRLPPVRLHTDLVRQTTNCGT